MLLVPAYVLWYPATLAWNLELGYPAITDLLLVSAYLALLVAVGRMIGRRTTGQRGVEVLDSLIIGVGVNSSTTGNGGRHDRTLP